MVERVYARVNQASLPQTVWVATDHERIADVVRGFGGRVVLTKRPAATGTDRIAEAIEAIPADLIVNVQGDEPLVDPAAVDQVIEALQQDPRAHVATLAFPILSHSDFVNPDVVKVVTNAAGDAMYFSRAPLPHGLAPSGTAFGLKHLGLYAYRREAIEAFAGWPEAACERAEKLEQLRFLENGMRIRVLEAKSDSLSVDRPEDVAAVERRIHDEGGARPIRSRANE